MYHEAHMATIGFRKLKDMRNRTEHNLVVVGFAMQAQERREDFDVVTTSVNRLT